MQFELNEIEARREQYPSTLSFINLINTLIAEEKDMSDRGQRYWSLYHCIFSGLFLLLMLILILDISLYFPQIYWHL